MIPESVRAKLETLPNSPGVYVFRDHADEVLYVGKARSLRSRVRSYFQPGSSDVRFFVARLDAELGDIETFVTATEKEAALLENQLIKRYQPRYNVKLKDDKEYLSLRLDPKRTWPRLEVVRRPRPDGALYFGPYHSATAARQTLRLVNRHFQLRTCTDAELRSRVRPCLQHQIKRCPAPCVLEVDEAAYAEQTRNVALFLEGRHDELVDQLTARMAEAAARLEYETAAMHRDQLRAVGRVHEEQRVTVVKDVDQDVVGFFRQADQAELAVLLVRQGKLIGVRTYDLEDVSLPDDELVGSFVTEFYSRGAPTPDEVLLPLEIEAMGGLADVLGERRGRKVRVTTPRRGPRAQLLRMAMENAAHAYKEKRRGEQDVEARLAQVQSKLRLPRPPHRIECIDVSHTGGEDTVAAIVALRDGVPDRKRYRSFRVRHVRGGDDYGAMYEVLSRRLRRGRDEEKGWDLPDLLVMDGGKGQLNVALAAMKDLGVEDLPVAGLAKEKENALGDKLVDRIYVPGQKNSIALRSAPALTMLALARDEAHRVANALRKKLGKRRQLRSELDSIPGVGPKTRTRLLSTLGSMRGVTEATEAELVAAGANKRQARAILEALGGAPEMSPGPTEAGAAEEAAVDNAFVSE